MQEQELKSSVREGVCMKTMEAISVYSVIWITAIPVEEVSIQCFHMLEYSGQELVQ